MPIGKSGTANTSRHYERIVVISNKIILFWNGLARVPWNDRLRRRIKLRDLDILMAVIAAGGMGKAAGRLNMSQSAISKAVADLEHTLGVRLLDRSRKGVEPTPYGHALVQRGAIVFDELRQSVADIDFLSDPTAGELRIGTTEPLAAAIISPVIDRLVRQHPLMSFHVITGDTGTLYTQLAARNVDFMLARISPRSQKSTVRTSSFAPPLSSSQGPEIH
jgi:DNA-binding transcriptional LysR family regulator